ncbi:MAG: sigma-70 family RNA polymerase sigma factor [Bacteroidaceae bacterium]|nr:sigma-70 family RNA polymerase sigma factor [Bacteroidaceae bacterium]
MKTDLRQSEDTRRQSENDLSPVLSAFRRTKSALRRMAGAMLGDEAEADDALQDAFCRLWPRREGIRTESEAAALFTTTVRRLSIDVLRRRKASPLVGLEEERVEVPDDTADATAEREECFRRVSALVEERLSPMQREILRRREYAGEDMDSIAEDLGMQPAAVRMQLSRARKTIRELYNRRYHEQQ